MAFLEDEIPAGTERSSISQPRKVMHRKKISGTILSVWKINQYVCVFRIEIVTLLSNGESSS